jgi:hypothetical protein
MSRTVAMIFIGIIETVTSAKKYAGDGKYYG